MEMTLTEFYIYLIIAQVIIGALLGLIPLILGRRRNKTRLGNYGFLTSIVAGAVSPLAALIVALIFAWLIARKESSPAPPPESEESIDSEPS